MLFLILGGADDFELLQKVRLEFVEKRLVRWLLRWWPGQAREVVRVEATRQ